MDVLAPLPLDVLALLIIGISNASGRLGADSSFNFE